MENLLVVNLKIRRRDPLSPSAFSHAGINIFPRQGSFVFSPLVILLSLPDTSETWLASRARKPDTFDSFYRGLGGYLSSGKRYSLF